MTREDIERDAAARIGVPVDLLEQSADTPVEHRAEEHETAGPEAHDHGQEADEHPVAAGDEHRPGRVSGWLRNLVSTESPEARRRRIEAEAEAELAVAGQAQQPPS